jgi:hypothetical protein
MFEKTCCPRLAVVADAVEVVEGVEDAADPMAVGPFDATCVGEAAAVVAPVAGVGGASKRMNIAKLMMSDEKSDDGLPLGVGSVKFVVSSGVELVAHPGVLVPLSIKQLGSVRSFV